MTPSLHERVAAAVELAGRATPGTYYGGKLQWFPACTELGTSSVLTKKPPCEEADPIAMCYGDNSFHNSEFIAASHDHVALIKELYAALLASEEENQRLLAMINCREIVID